LSDSAVFPTPESKRKPRSKSLAVIEIGSTGIRMVVAELDGSGGFKVLDRAGKPSRLGRDVFTSGLVSREALRECIAVLSSFRELIRGFGLEPKDARVFATSALREAQNRDTFVDRVELHTGFKVAVIEDIEENHLMYLGVQHALQGQRDLISRSNALILEVGGGSTEIMLLKRGRMAGAHSLRIGTVRIDEQLRGAGMPQSQLRQFIEDNVRTSCDNLDAELPLESVKTFIVIGSDARLAATRLAATPACSDDGSDCSIIDRANFIDFAEEIASLPPEDLVGKIHIPWSEAESIGMSLTIERLFLERTAAESVLVPNVSIREGFLIAESLGPDAGIEAEMRSQIIAGAAALGRKYHIDESHARHVTDLALSIFDALVREHGLGRRERLILEVAGLVHDVGTFIRTSGHHKHGEYIVQNSEIFGLTRSELTIIANVVRYHRKAPPAPTHVNFIALPREDRIIVMKLAAILRVADALDRGHDRRIHDPAFERREDRFVIRPAGDADFSLERLSLAEKGDMFEDVFGLEPVLA
jgi:exopolyphosphatase/guanosine-5'-triphosphate,3'-diphosphate pyrophosphatase